MSPEAHKDSVERDLPNLSSDMDHTDMELEMELLLSTQLVPPSPPEAHKDSAESVLLNQDGDTTTINFLETLSSPDLESVTTQEVNNVEPRESDLLNQDGDTTTMPFLETLSFADLESVTTQEVSSAVNQLLQVIVI